MNEEISYYEKIGNTVTCIDDELPFEIPESWSWARLGQLCQSVQYGLSNSAETYGTHRLLRITDIQNGNVEWESVPFTTVTNAADYILKKNDIVFARTGATVGKSFLITDLPFDTVYASYLIRIRSTIKISTDYLYHFFRSSFYWAQITDKSVGVGQPNCNGTSLKELLIPLPPKQEQEKIAGNVRRYIDSLEYIEKSLN